MKNTQESNLKERQINLYSISVPFSTDFSPLRTGEAGISGVCCKRAYSLHLCQGRVREDRQEGK